MKRFLYTLILLLAVAGCQSSDSTVAITPSPSPDPGLEGFAPTPTAMPDTTVLDENQVAVDANLLEGDAAPRLGDFFTENNVEGQEINPDEILSGNSETYVSDVSGFAFDYPEGWFVNDAGDGTTVAVSNFETQGAVGPLEVGPDQTLIQFSALGSEGSLEEQAAAEAASLEAGGATIARQSQFVMPNGSPAVLIQYNDNLGEFVKLFTDVGGRGLVITAQGNLIIFAPIVGTLRPSDPSELLNAESTSEPSTQEVGQ